APTLYVFCSYIRCHEYAQRRSSRCRDARSFPQEISECALVNSQGCRFRSCPVPYICRPWWIDSIDLVELLSAPFPKLFRSAWRRRQGQRQSNSRHSQERHVLPRLRQTRPRDEKRLPEK